MRLIDADKFIEEMGDTDFDILISEVCEMIEATPTIETCEDAISREDALKSDALMFDSKSGIYWIPAYHIENLPPVAPSRRGGDWIDLFEEIGNAYDTIGEGAETNAFNRGIEACAEIVRRFFGLNMRQEKR